MKLSVIHQRVGETRTGKIISCASWVKDVPIIVTHFTLQNFSDDDLLDVYAVFEYLAVRAVRRRLPYEIYSVHSRAVLEELTIDCFEKVKTKANIITVFDLRALGVSLVAKEFKDL